MLRAAWSVVNKEIGCHNILCNGMEWRKLKVASPADAVLVERILWQNCATVAQIELALLVPEFYSSKTNCKY